MNIEIDVMQLMTEDHKRALQLKLGKAIELIDEKKLAKELQVSLMDFDYGNFIIDELDLESIAKTITEKLKKAI